MLLLTNKTNEELAKETTEYSPEGRVFKEKRNFDSNLFGFFKAFAPEQRRFIENVNKAYEGLFPRLSTELLSDHEADLGIPDSCFTAQGTIEERQIDVIVKKYMMNGNRDQDFIDIAAMYGITITIQTGNATSLFPIEFPMTFKTDKGVMFITFEDIPETLSSFPWTFPQPFGGRSPVEKLKCIFNRIKKSTTTIFYRVNET